MENNPETITTQPSPDQPPSNPPILQPTQLSQPPQQPVIIQIQRPESPVEQRIKKVWFIFSIVSVLLVFTGITALRYNMDTVPKRTMTIFNERAKTTLSSVDGVTAASTFECKLNGNETWSYDVKSSVEIAVATNEEFIKIAHNALTKMLAVMRLVHAEYPSGCTNGYLHFASQDDRISVGYYFSITDRDDTALHNELDTEYQAELESLQQKLDE